ncbi:MAG: hypothetical protein CM1200mP36_08080 [Gammaproteobacteria bacterium]|nr:MAG: hypothetical protein CM1200mP36_08080 [Gammaproteobacteria bacterium]
MIVLCLLSSWIFGSPARLPDDIDRTMLWLHERDTIDCRHIDAFTQTPRVGYDAALAVIHIIEPFQHFLSLINRHLTRYRIAPDVSRTSTILTLPFSYERDVLLNVCACLILHGT